MRFYFCALFIFFVARANAQITIITSTSQGGNVNAVTTSAINTTGAIAIVAQIGAFNLNVNGVMTDSKSNTWTLVRTDMVTSSLANVFYLCSPCTVGTGHTFTYTKSGSGPGLNILALGNVAQTPLDQQNGNSASTVTTIQPGSVTPTLNNEIVLCGLGASNTLGTPTINSGFTISTSVPFSTGVTEESALAYKIQTASAAVNPTWTMANSAIAATSIMTLKAVINSSGILLITQ